MKSGNVISLKEVAARRRMDEALARRPKRGMLWNFCCSTLIVTVLVLLWLAWWFS